VYMTVKTASKITKIMLGGGRPQAAEFSRQAEYFQH